MHSDEDGRVLITSNASLKFLMLNPGVHFKGMLKSARAIVLAGGTMQPMADFTQQLFSDFPSDRVTLFSCGHIIPPQNLRALSVMRGPTNVEFEYSYGTRSSTSVIDELGRTMANLSMVIPDGIIVFFPSYMYEDEVYHHWESSGVLTRITLRKKIFRETRTTSRGEEVLRAYQQCIESGRGAVLLSVVGGKMSEGINFSDKLGRCVVMVGLPFSNPQDPELVERMKYLGQKAGEVVNATEPLRSQVCREFYENQCMKAVNQTIGRCIRHIGDYAVILLCDRRYARTSIRQKLPKWISSQLQETTSFGDVMSSVARFFQDRRKEDR